MYFKYLADPRTEIGVKIFGMAHGIVFIAFVIAAILVGRAMSWRIATWLLALLGSIVLAEISGFDSAAAEIVSTPADSVVFRVAIGDRRGSGLRFVRTVL